MRLLKLFIFLLCGICITSWAQQEKSALHDAKGNEISVSQLKGKWVIVNYWATWCENCLEEIPELNRFYQHNQDKNIVLYGVNYDQIPMTDLQQAMSKMHIKFPVVLEDPAQIWSLNAVDALPMTFIIDPNGHVAKRILGGNTEKSLLDIVHELQKKPV